MNAENPSPRLLTPREVAARLSLSVTAVYDLCNSGELLCHKVGVKRSRRRISETALAEYLERTLGPNGPGGSGGAGAILQLPTKTRRKAVEVHGRGARGLEIMRAGGWKG